MEHYGGGRVSGDITPSSYNYVCDHVHVQRTILDVHGVCLDWCVCACVGLEAVVRQDDRNVSHHPIHHFSHLNDVKYWKIIKY